MILTPAIPTPCDAAPLGRFGRLLIQARTAFEQLRHDTPSGGRPDSELLRRFGSVVWAALIEVCNPASDPDARVLLVYGVDPRYVDDRGALLAVARRVSDLRKAGSSDPRTQTLLQMLRRPWMPGRCVSLSLDLVEGCEVYVATASWRRSGLPGKRLADEVLPVVVMPEATAAVGVLPILCWPPELAAEWLSAGRAETGGVDEGL